MSKFKNQNLHFSKKFVKSRRWLKFTKFEDRSCENIVKLGLTSQPHKTRYLQADPKVTKVKGKSVGFKMLSGNLPNLTSILKELFEVIEETKPEINRLLMVFAKTPETTSALSSLDLRLSKHDFLDKVLPIFTTMTEEVWPFSFQRERERIEH